MFIDKPIVIGINLGDAGSTGNIMMNSLLYSMDNGFDAMAIVPYSTQPNNNIKIFEYQTNHSLIKKGKIFLWRIISPRSKEDGNHYRFFSKKIIKVLEKEKKSHSGLIVHIHNIHHSNITFSTLFHYLKKRKIPVIYSLHDCWPFTGGCYHPGICNNWKTKCDKCPQRVKHSNINYLMKAKCLTSLDKILLCPVSNWLNDNIKESSLKKLHSKVIYGETPLVPPTENVEEFKKQLNLSNNKIVLSVASYWDDMKGTKYIYDIASMLPENYIYLVIGEKFNKNGHNNIIHIQNVNQKELAKYYSISDVYVSTTQQEALGLTTCEAQICGIPVVGFGNTGSKETITSKSGIMLNGINDCSELVKNIIYVVEKRPFKREDILASGSRFKKNNAARNYYNIYKELINNG